MLFERPARVPIWIAGISICVLAASGIVAIVRWIPASYASIPAEKAESKLAEAPSGSEGARAGDALAPITVAREKANRRTRTECRECGVVESIRKIERSGNVGKQDTVDVKVPKGDPGSGSGNAIAANAITEKGYEFTVRFRDGSTTLLNEASPRTWPLGSRVMVIGRSKVSSN